MCDIEFRWPARAGSTYARMTKQEYATWVDRLVAVKRIDTARTTSLPVMDAADALAAYI